MRLWNQADGHRVKPNMDDEQREAIRAEGLDPDDPAVRSALDLVRWELELLGQSLFGSELDGPI